MNIEKLKDSVRLARQSGFVMVATCDDAGLPHITAAGRIELADQSDIAVTEWFCPGTVANLQKNKNISVVVWTKKLNSGYQLLGRLDSVTDVGILDGYSKREEKHPLPQIEKRLLIKVQKILEFRLGPHSDVED